MGRAFLVAVQFLTRVPVPQVAASSNEEVGHSILFYPLVGLLIGLVLAATAWATRAAILDVRAALVLGVWVFITGALHLDGLADTADAWVGGFGDRERTLAIMKDPYTGPVGVAVLVLVLLIKFAAIKGSLIHAELGALVLTPMIGRTMVPILFLTTPYVRSGGLGVALANNLPRRATSVVSVFTVALSIWVDPTALWALIASGLVFLGLRMWMLQRITGTTGDTAGALIELTEVVLLTAASLSWTYR